MGTGQAIGFLAAPILSRLYTPADFGTFLIFSNVFSILNIIITLRYEQATIFVKHAVEAADLFSIAIYSTIIISLILLIGAAIGTDLTDKYQPYEPLLYLVIISALAAGLQRCTSVMLNRWENFYATARLNLVRPGAVGLIQSSIGLITASPISLAIGHSLANIFLLIYTVKQEKRICKFLQYKSYSALLKTAIQHSSFPKYNMTQNLVYVVTESAIPLALVSMTGTTAGGLYWLAARITTAPMQIFVESVRPIIYREISALMLGKKEVRVMILKSAWRLCWPFVLATIFLFIAGPKIFSIIFGNKWTDASTIASILMIYAAIHACAVPIIATLPILKRQHTHLHFEIIVLISRLIVFYVFAYKGATTALAMSVLVGTLVYGVFFSLVLTWVADWQNTHATKQINNID
jgi:O-antigen/teichoic acid export membrane protein